MEGRSGRSSSIFLIIRCRELRSFDGMVGSVGPGGDGARFSNAG